MKTIAIVAGARPNFMKVAPIVRALRHYDRQVTFKIIHTGQHYDQEMNAVFFEELGIPEPDVFLGSGSGSHAVQTARIMVAFEQFCVDQRPHLVLVVGDVNSTLACSIVAKKAGIPVAHVEAGLRSHDMTMPEEVNRIVTDSIADLFFVTEPSGVDHLLREGRPHDRIHLVGNVMVDTLLFQRYKLGATDKSAYRSTAIQAQHPRYGTVTLHRPSNVDDARALAAIASALSDISAELPLVFPVHPRTRSNLEKFGTALGSNVILTPPLPYMDFLNLWINATVVLTDSGGLQEETTALGIPCITIRNNTERPITVDEGTNVVAGTDPTRIREAAREVLRGAGKAGKCPSLWDGRAAERIAEILSHFLARPPEEDQGRG